MKKIVHLYDGIVDFVALEIILRDDKTKLKIARQNKNQLNKRERPEALGPLDAIKSGPKINQKDGKYFNI